MTLQFANAWVLYGLWLVPILGLIWLMLYHRQSRALEHFLSPVMRQKLCPPPQPQRFYWQWACILAGFLLAIIAAAQPQWGLREEMVIQRGRDLVILLDVSRSMLAQDVHPSRLQRAKTDIQDLLRELRGDRAALVTFRGRAIQMCPLTTDYAYLEQILNNVTVESAPRGQTDIGAAILKALTVFENDKGSHRAIVLISDGEDLSGKARQAAEEAKKKGVVIFTVGLGDPKGAKIPSTTEKNAVMMYQGKEVVTSLKHDTLKSIAEITGGAYVPVGVANVKLGTLYRDHLSKIAAQDIEESIQRRYIDRYQWFLGPALLCLLVVAFLSRGRLAKTTAPGKPLKHQIDALHHSSNMATTHPPPLQGGEQDQGKIPSQEGRPDISGRGGFMKQTPPDSRKHMPGLTLALLLAGNVMAGTASSATNMPVISAAALSNAPVSTASISNTVPAKPTVDIPTGKEGARIAQRLYRQGKYKEAAQTYLQAAQGSIKKLQNDMLFNAACALYRAGQYRAAAGQFAQVARQEESPAAAAHYNAGCALFHTAEQAVSGSESNRNYGARPPLLEQSGQAFQRALRLDPQQSSARNNLATVVQTLPESREQAKIQALMKKYGQTPPFKIADELLTGQRKLIEDMPPAMTNPTPARISMMEALGARQRQNTDLLIPLRANLVKAMASMPAQPGPGGQQPGFSGAGSASNAPASPQQKIAEISRHIDAVRNTMQASREDLRNLENRAYTSASIAESGIFTLWKAMAPFPPLLREDMRWPPNAMDMTRAVMPQATETASRNILAQQEEAIQLTQLFTDRFKQTVPPEGLKPQPAAGPVPGMPSQILQPAPPATAKAGLPAAATAKAGSTNATPEEGITPEKRAQILNLASEAKACQEQSSKLLTESNLKDSLVEQQNAYKMLLEIEKLLPKDKNKQNQQNKDPQKQQQDQQKKQQDQQDKKDQDQQKQEQEQQEQEQKKEESQPPPKQQPEQEQKPQPAAEDKEKPPDKEMTPEQARALLEKARQREKDHKKERMQDRYIPPSPVEKDW